MRGLVVALVLPREQARLAHDLFVELAAHSIAQQEARLRREANAELGDDLWRQPTRFQVFAGVRRLRSLELLLKEGAGALVNVEQAATLFGLARASSGDE